MNKHSNYSTDAQKLRKKAEDLLKKKSSKTKVSAPEADQVKLVYELQVHQIELELQNEELRTANSIAQLAVKNYTELFDFTPACYYTLTSEGEILSLNKSGAHMLGKAPVNLIGRRFGLFVSDETKPIFNQFLQNIFSLKIKENCEVTLLTDKNRPVQVYLIGLITKNGTDCHINLVDISEIKKKEEERKAMFDDLTIVHGKNVAQKVEIENGVRELVIAHKELEQSLNLNADKNLFISILAHDLKSPFSVLLGFTEVLMETIQQKDLAEIETIAKDINLSAKITFELLEDMLKWARMQSGSMPFKPKKLKFAHLSKEVIETLRPYANSKSIKLIDSVSDDIYAFADRNMVDAVLRNLVSNSIKFTNQNGVVEISASQSGSNLIISVSDNGIGIDPGKLSKLFDITQFHSTDGTAKEKGTGLGLLICKEFVEKHGGKIWVESVVGEGSKFNFSLPFKVEPKEINIKPENADEDEIKDLKILIVDDQSSLRLILGEMVRHFSRETLYASSGKEAIEITRKNSDLDLILMDFQMTEMNGYEAAKKIRHLNKEVIIILQTAFELTEISDKENDAFINGYFTKPYNKLSLLHMISTHFKKASGK